MMPIWENSSREELLRELQRIKGEASSLKDIINTSPAIAFSWRMAPGWPVDFVSDNISTLGYTPDDFYSGKYKILDIVHPDEQAEVVKQSLHKAFTLRRREFGQEYRIARKDGSFIWVDSRILVVRQDRGKITRFQGILLDITEQKEARSKEFATRVILRTVIDNLPQLVYWKDLNSNYLGCNKAFAREAGFQFPHQIIGKNDLDLGFPPQEVKLSRQMDKHIIDSKEPLTEYLYEEQREGREGDILKINKMPLYDASGEIIGIVGTAEDISEKIKTERELSNHRDHLEKLVKARTLELTQAKERVEKINSAMTKQWDFLRTVIEHMPAIIYVKDAESRFIIANQATIEMMGASSEDELKGKTDYDFYPMENADPFFRDELELLEEKVEKIEKEEHILSLNTGEKKWIYTTKLPLRDKDNKISGLIGIGHDITPRKLAEKERELLIAKAESANKAKSVFLANMSHEIRTPLNGVIGMTSLLLDTKLDENQQHYVNTLRKSGEFLLAIINDILDLSKIESGKLELSLIPFTLGEILNSVSDIALSKVTTDKVELLINSAPEIPECMVGDPDRLKQILLNLVSNALKFTEEGVVYVKVQLVEDSKEDILLRFSVTDTGIGISNEKMGLLFQNFSQLDNSTTRKYGGTGLGLTISKQLCEMMGGTIGVDSREGAGSEFWFTACFQKFDGKAEEIGDYKATVEQPLLSPESRQSALSSSGNFTTSQSDENTTSLIIAEDNPINQQVMLGILGKLGFSRIDIAQNGVEVLKALEQKTYQLILMDLSMPLMDGLTTTEKIRSTTFSKNENTIPIIALTAHAIKGDREMCLEKGMNDYLTKPVNPQELKRILDKWLSDVPPASTMSPELQHKSTELSHQFFDYETMLNRLMGDKQLAAHIIRLFLDETPLQLEKLGQLLAEKNIEEAGYLAHKLLGASANVNVDRFYTISRKMEEECFHGTTANLNSLYGQLVEQFELARHEMLQFA